MTMYVTFKNTECTCANRYWLIDEHLYINIEFSAFHLKINYTFNFRSNAAGGQDKSYE